MTYHGMQHVPTLSEELWSTSKNASKWNTLEISILDKYEHLIGRKVSTPGEPGTHIQPGHKDYESALPIHSILGSLIYACNTCIDLTSAVSHACRYQSCPSPELKCAICCILSYLKSAPHLGIRYIWLPGWKQGEPLQLSGCCDTGSVNSQSCPEHDRGPYYQDPDWGDHPPRDYRDYCSKDGRPWSDLRRDNHDWHCREDKSGSGLAPVV